VVKISAQYAKVRGQDLVPPVKEQEKLIERLVLAVRELDI